MVIGEIDHGHNRNGGACLRSLGARPKVAKLKVCINDKGKARMVLEITGSVLLKESERPYTVNGNKCRYRLIPRRFDIVCRVQRRSESNELGIMFGPRSLLFSRYDVRDTHINAIESSEGTGTPLPPRKPAHMFFQPRQDVLTIQR